MLIPFETMEVSVINGMRGGEGEARLQSYADEQNKIMKLSLAPGASLGFHTHETNSETLFVLSGTGKMLYEGAEEVLAPGVCHYCPKGHGHKLVNDGTEPLVVFVLVPEHGA